MKEELIAYIETLTPAQIEKIINQIPRLTELLDKSSRFCPREFLE